MIEVTKEEMAEITKPRPHPCFSCPMGNGYCTHQTSCDAVQDYRKSFRDLNGELLNLAVEYNENHNELLRAINKYKAELDNLTKQLGKYHHDFNERVKIKDGEA